MVCKHCGTENPEEAVFCMTCGERVDGKVHCPVCGALNPTEATFCIQCGGRMDNKRVCPECGTLNEAGVNFCLGCGHAFEKPRAQKSARSRETSREGGRTLADWFRLFGGIGVMAAAFFALVFTFCIGITTRTESLFDTVTETDFLYVYFGGRYKTLASALKGVGEGAGYMKFALYFPTVLGTLVAAGGLVSVIALSAVAAVRYVRALMQRDGKTNFFRPAVAAYAVFVAAATAIRALNGTSDGTSTISLNGATIAGIVLGAVFLVAGTVLNLLPEGKELLTRKKLTLLISAAVGGVFFVLIFALAPMGIGAVESGDSVTASTASTASLMATIGSLYYSMGFGSYGSTSVDAPIGQAIVYALSQLFQLAVITLALFAFIKLFADLTSEKAKSPLRLVIPLVVCAAGYLAMTVTVGALFNSYLETDVKFGYAAPAVLFVFSVLQLARVIAEKLLCKKFGH